MAYIPSQGSVVAFQSDPTKLVGTVSITGAVNPSSVYVTNPVSLLAINPASVYVVNPVSILGVTQGTTPWLVESVSSVLVAVKSTAGSVITTPGTATYITSVVNTVPSSLLVGASIIGLTPVAPTPSSVYTIQGTSPWVVNSVITTVQSSVAAAITNISASVLAFLGSSNASIITDNLVTRNDTMASILGVDLTTRALMGDSLGRTVIKPFAPEDATIISYAGSVVSTSVTLIQASVAGKRSYITDFWIANSGSVATVVQFRENGTSVIGTTIAPAGGGSNSPGIAIPIKTTNVNLDLSFTGLTATSVLYVNVKGYQGQ